MVRPRSGAAQLNRGALGAPLHRVNHLTRTFVAAIAVVWLHAPPVKAQRVPSTRDSVARLVSHVARAGGNFPTSLAAGDYQGDKTPFEALQPLFDASPDSVLRALTDCFTDSSATRVTWEGKGMRRGAICYVFLRHLVYRETDPGKSWPGNFEGYPTPQRLRAAQSAWREAIRHHWYSAS